MKPLVLAAVVTGCAHAAAPVPAAAPAPALSPSLASLAFYVGNWQCEGQAFDDAGKVTQSYALEIRVVPEMPNWMRIGVYDHGTQVTSELKGVSADGHYHHLWTSDDGTSGSLTSTGWDGNKLVFEEDHPIPTEKARMTFTKLDATHYQHEAEVDTGHGFARVFAKSCHKV